MITEATSLSTTIPDDIALFLRAAILIAGVGALALTAAFSWGYREFIRGYGLLILTGIICFQIATVYGNAWALSRGGVPLSWSGLFALAGNLIFCVVCLEPARRKRMRIARGNEDMAGILGD